MNVVEVTPPGRFPTVVHDPGDWWNALVARGEAETSRFSANAAWWRVVCSEEGLGIVIRSRVARGLSTVLGLSLEATARRAGRALDELRAPATYEVAQRYLAAVGAIRAHLDNLNGLQRELALSVEAGPHVRDLDYDDSHELADYARRTTRLSRLVEAALRTMAPDADVVLIRVTGPEDLLSALITARLLRQGNPRPHVCLTDHGYENYSLAPHLSRLRSAGTLDSLFDTIVEARNERDVVVPMLVAALRQGCRPRGYVRIADLPPAASVAPADRGLARVAPPVETFASEPIFWTRVSQGRCYWSRCTFCVQNLKYADGARPSMTDVPAAVDRIAAAVGAGYRSFIFSDEALSPALLQAFSAAIRERGIAIRWGCRSKLERSFTPGLFAEMRAAGCYEILFGLESVSDRVLRLMDKHVEGLGSAEVAAIFRAAAAAGIGLHVNLIGGFPGERADELESSVQFLASSLRSAPNSTFLLNRFSLFAGTPVAESPAAYEIDLTAAPGDMPSALAYRTTSPDAPTVVEVDGTVRAARQTLHELLGWPDPEVDASLGTAVRLYFGSGHGSLFKASPDNAFERAIRCIGPRSDHAAGMPIAHQGGEETPWRAAASS